MRRISLVVFFVLSILLTTGLVFAEESGKKPVVFVSIVPQKYFVEQIAGDLVNVEVMVLPGASPATYEPKPSQMEKLSAAKAYLAIGVPFEKAWLPRLRAANPKLTVVATDKGITKRAMEEHHHEAEGHHEHHDKDAHKHHEGDHHKKDVHHHDHHHGIADPHIWLEPTLVKVQAENIATALNKIVPEQQNVIAENLAKFQKNLDILDAEIKEVLSSVSGKKFMVFHPSWGYFAERYGLHQIAAENSGKSPSPAQLAELIDTAKKEGITTIFVQPQFSKKSASVIAKEISGVVDTANPLSENWAENLREVAEKLAGKKE